MCGRYTLTSDIEAFEHSLGDLDIEFDPGPRYNVAPTQEVAILCGNGGFKITGARWGLIPAWAKDPSMGNRMINARSETLADKPSFKRAFKERRCLVLADGFYEWKSVPGQKRKAPHYICLKNRKPFAFAGLWERWEDPGGDSIRTCTIITTEPNALVRAIHNRMPVILDPDAYPSWLDHAGHAPPDVQPLLAPYDADRMEAFPVSTAVNKVSLDSPACLERPSDDTAGDLFGAP